MQEEIEILNQAENQLDKVMRILQESEKLDRELGLVSMPRSSEDNTRHATLEAAPIVHETDLQLVKRQKTEQSDKLQIEEPEPLQQSLGINNKANDAPTFRQKTATQESVDDDHEEQKSEAVSVYSEPGQTREAFHPRIIQTTRSQSVANLSESGRPNETGNNFFEIDKVIDEDYKKNDKVEFPVEDSKALLNKQKHKKMLAAETRDFKQVQSQLQLLKAKTKNILSTEDLGTKVPKKQVTGRPPRNKPFQDTLNMIEKHRQENEKNEDPYISVGQPTSHKSRLQLLKKKIPQNAQSHTSLNADLLHLEDYKPAENTENVKPLPSAKSAKGALKPPLPAADKIKVRVQSEDAYPKAEEKRATATTPREDGVLGDKKVHVNSSSNLELVKRLNAEKRARQKKKEAQDRARQEKMSKELEEKERELAHREQLKQQDKLRKKDEIEQRIQDRQKRKEQTLAQMKEETKKMSRGAYSALPTYTKPFERHSSVSELAVPRQADVRQSSQSESKQQYGLDPAAEPVVRKPRLYMSMQRDFENKVVKQEENQRQEKLQEIKLSRQPVSFKDIQVHQKKYANILNEKKERLRSQRNGGQGAFQQDNDYDLPNAMYPEGDDHNGGVRSQGARGRSGISYRSHLLADIKRKDHENRHKNEIEFLEKQKMKERANSYAKYVKEIYRPKNKGVRGLQDVSGVTSDDPQLTAYERQVEEQVNQAKMNAQLPPLYQR